MDNTDYSHHPFEPTPDELPKKSNYHFELDRRKFFKITGGGLIVAFVIKDLVSFAGKTTLIQPSPLAAGDVDAWIHIGKDGVRSEEHTSELQSQSNLVCR